MAESTHSPFLGLPTELRLLIYASALLEGSAITIGSAELVGVHADIVHRLYGDRRNPLPGLPQNHEPVVESRYDASLLSITNPPVIPLTPLTSCPPESPPNSGPHETHAALLCTNKQIHEELVSHFNLPMNRKTSLFISYPHGLHILATSTARLMRQARSLHIAGTYAPRTFDPQRAARLGCSLHPATQLNNEAKNYYGGVTPPHADQLGTLIASTFGPDARHEVKKLELRIYYPGPDSYSTVWGDDNSPTVVALRNIYAGEVTIEVWRGRWGTGVYLYVVPNHEEPNSEGSAGTGRGKRVVSTVWRRLGEGRRGETNCGSWIIDPAWPDWKEDGGNIGENEGCVVSSIPVAPSSS